MRQNSISFIGTPPRHFPVPKLRSEAWTEALLYVRPSALVSQSIVGIPDIQLKSSSFLSP